jgi:broad specificity phosphatase PhoE
VSVALACPHRIWFIRHGETEYNREGRLQGQRDIPLNPKGREQASAVGRTLKKLARAELDRLEAAHAFVASPLMRTRQTIELARAAMGFPPADYALCDDLKELTFGDWEGFTWPEVEARFPEGAAERATNKWSFTPPNGESYATLALRLTPWIAGLSQDVFVASHGGVARALMRLIGRVAPGIAAEANIFQGRALMFAEGGFQWLG